MHSQSMTKWHDVPVWLSFAVFLAQFHIGTAFVVPSWNRQHSHQPSRCEYDQRSGVCNRSAVQSLLRLPASAAKAVADLSAANENGGKVSRFFWDFQGFPCYAEISRPSTENKGWLPSLPSTKNRGGSENPQVILIHGFGCSTVYWRETRSYLTNAGYTVHSVDLLGQGKSAKPGRAPPDKVCYSIDLWARMVDDYARRYVGKAKVEKGGVVLVGNSLGSVVALSAATGDCYGDSEKDGKGQVSFLASKVRGLCFYNIGVGMNSRNVVKVISPDWLKALVSAIFSALDKLIFDNSSLLTYVIENQLSKEVLRNALLNLYACADDPERRVDDELVDSFLNPVLKDPTAAVVEVIRQIYTNDAGKTPMEFHEKYYIRKGNGDSKEPSSSSTSSSPSWFFGLGGGKVGAANAQTELMPIHLVWGDKDNVTPLSGPVGQFYSALATSNGGADSGVDVSLEVVRAGHIPFDERPECNESFVKWLRDLDSSKKRKYRDQTTASSASLEWPLKF